VATDRGGGTIAVTGGTFRSSGQGSPGLYSTGVLTARNASFVATGSEAVVIEGANSVAVTNTSLSGAKKRGVMLYQSFSGDAEGSTSVYRQTGGSLNAAEGPAFFVTNATGKIYLSGATVTAASGVLLLAAADQWGTSGSNGGHAILAASGQKLKGSVTVDKLSSASLTLAKTSSLTGAINTAGTAKGMTLSLSADSTWTVTADSHLTSLSGAEISGSQVINIVGNGHTVHYSAAGSSALGGKVYTLSGGGTLKPT
jgi:hypothetical protein